MTDNTAIARAMFNAFEAADLEAARGVLADGFKASQNGGPAMNLSMLLAFVGAVKAKVPDFRYEDIVCEATPSGFVEEHTVRGTLPDGEQLNLRLCIVATIEDGRVTDVREYLDTLAAAGLAKALAA
ncbi:MAG: nuclear transport factor 2 family protein [Pseudomonadota bacterium]